MLNQVREEPDDLRVLACLERLFCRRGKDLELAELLARIELRPTHSGVDARQCRVRCLAKARPQDALQALRLSDWEPSASPRMVLIESVWGALLDDHGTFRSRALELAATVLPATLRAKTGEVLVMFKSGRTNAGMDGLRARQKLRSLKTKRLGRSGWQLVSFDKTTDVRQAVAEFRASSDVAYAEPNQLIVRTR